MFDPNSFITNETDATFETSFTPLPEDDYRATISDLSADQVGANNTPILRVKWTVDLSNNPEAMNLLGRESTDVEQTIWLDIATNGSLEVGPNKNVALGKLRDALGQNDGSPWSPSMLLGQVATVQVNHRIDKNTGNAYPNIRGVTPA